MALHCALFFADRWNLCTRSCWILSNEQAVETKKSEILTQSLQSICRHKTSPEQQHQQTWGNVTYISAASWISPSFATQIQQPLCVAYPSEEEDTASGLNEPPGVLSSIWKYISLLLVANSCISKLHMLFCKVHFFGLWIQETNLRTQINLYLGWQSLRPWCRNPFTQYQKCKLEE